MTLKKHYYLLSLLALVTVGAAFNTSQSVSAQVYSNEGYHQHLTDEKSHLQYSKDNAQLQLRNILDGYQNDLGRRKGLKGCDIKLLSNIFRDDKFLVAITNRIGFCKGINLS